MSDGRGRPSDESARVGAVDIGTNTVLLLIAEGPPEAPVAVFEGARITRLGEGVDRTRRLSEGGMARTLAALAEYEEVLRRHGVSRIDVVATSAARDAANGDEFLSRAKAALGVRPRIVSGAEEAELTFGGALTGLPESGEVTVFDLGGGSTEIVRGSVSPKRILDATSLDVGSVRLTERHVRHDPPLSSELDAIRADVARALSGVQRSGMTHLVGIAGTVTTLAAIDQELAVYDSARVHGSTLSRDAVARVLARLAAVPLEERRATTGLDAGRADVIVAGAVIVHGLLDFFGVTAVTVSDRGVRWGLAQRLL